MYILVCPLCCYIFVNQMIIWQSKWHALLFICWCCTRRLCCNKPLIFKAAMCKLVTFSKLSNTKCLVWWVGHLPKVLVFDNCMRLNNQPSTRNDETVFKGWVTPWLTNLNWRWNVPWSDHNMFSVVSLLHLSPKVNTSRNIVNKWLRTFSWLLHCDWQQGGFISLTTSSLNDNQSF